MSRAVWKYLHASHEPSYTYWQAFRGDFGAVTGHTVELTDETAEGVGPKLVFKGDFTVDNGVVTAGTVRGFDIYEDGVKVVKAKGYHFTIDAVKIAMAAAGSPDLSDPGPAYLLIAQKTVHRGSAGDDPMFGNDMSHSPDHFIGKGGNDIIEGGLGNDLLKGGPGDDSLWLWHGRDRAFGGPGHDTFVFRDEAGQVDVDKIKDFHPGEDILQLGAPEYAVLTPGVLQASEFHAGKHAEDPDDYIIYRKGKGAIYFDHDGAGGDAQVLIGKVETGLHLTHGDFLVESLG